jgi:hypothetical protein
LNLPSIPSSLGVLIGRGAGLSPDAPSCRWNSIKIGPLPRVVSPHCGVSVANIIAKIALKLIALPNDARVPSSTCATSPLSGMLKPKYLPFKREPRGDIDDVSDLPSSHRHPAICDGGNADCQVDRTHLIPESLRIFVADSESTMPLINLGPSTNPSVIGPRSARGGVCLQQHPGFCRTP